MNHKLIDIKYTLAG